MRHLTFICWKWRPRQAYRSKFESAHVNTLHSMITRHYHGPFELVCVTDDAGGINPAIRIVPMWADYAHVPSPHEPAIRLATAG